MQAKRGRTGAVQADAAEKLHGSSFWVYVLEFVKGGDGTPWEKENGRTVACDLGVNAWFRAPAP
jgi:hypothetical protein